jgi:hypothetical protein
MTRSSG